VGPRAGLDGAEILVPTGIRSRTVQPVVTIVTELPSPLPDIVMMDKIREMSWWEWGLNVLGEKYTRNFGCETENF